MSRELEGPATDGPRSDEACELGDVALEPVARPNERTQAPGFQATTLDGEAGAGRRIRQTR